MVQIHICFGISLQEKILRTLRKSSYCTYISKIYDRFSTSRSNNNYTQIDKKHQSGKKANCFHFIRPTSDATATATVSTLPKKTNYKREI